MTRCSAVVALALLVAVSAPAVRAQTPEVRYQPTWESLDARPTPAWYLDAKFGIFIHWGIYAVPSFADPQEYAEWYWHTLRAEPGTNARTNKNHQETTEFHNRVFGPGFSYEQFAPMFKAELFDPDEWAAVIKQSGAKYVALTSKHHDGFS